jgi:hypothetical protein
MLSIFESSFNAFIKIKIPFSYKQGKTKKTTINIANKILHILKKMRTKIGYNGRLKAYLLDTNAFVYLLVLAKIIRKTWKGIFVCMITMICSLLCLGLYCYRSCGSPLCSRLFCRSILSRNKQNLPELQLLFYEDICT